MKEEEKRTVSPVVFQEFVLIIVSRYFEVDPRLVHGAHRYDNVKHARLVAMHLMIEYGLGSKTQIADYFGRSNAFIPVNAEAMEKSVSGTPGNRKDYEELARQIQHGLYHALKATEGEG